ncbi:MAG: ATP-binding protein [Candidatus Gracilibacteria bacterium]|nr:ATP-binding protein [Candidatus Gracilibacteria bacterium]
MTKDTGFDAFFRAVTSSPEFKTAAEKDYIGDFKKGLDEMEQNLKNATKISDTFNDAFNTPEAIEAGENYSSSYTPYINKTEETVSKEMKLDIQYFENKNPATFGFAGVAGMAKLKENLRESFIRPLKFKFLVQKLEEENLSPPPSGTPLNKDDTIDSKKDAKNKLYKQINEAYKKFNVNIPTGLLFYGPPGTGKTFITKKLAEELGAGLIKKSVGEFGSSYIHQTSNNIKSFFKQAKEASEKGPIILFLDEIDSLLSKRTDNIDANKAEEISQFLQEFNALEEAPNLIVIAATNRPDHLDSAILRSGRFDKKVYIGAPDKIARKELFQINIEKVNRPHKELDYDKLAELTDGYVSADIEAICDEVSRDASKSILDLANMVDNENANFDNIKEQLDDSIITMELLEQAIKETTSSIKYTDMSIYDNWLKEEQKETVRV